MPEWDASALTSRQRWLSLGAVYACIFANGVGMGLSLPLLSLILERHGVSGTIQGLNAAFGAVALITVTPFVPTVAARLGSVRFLIVCYAVAAISILSFRATDALVLWFVLRFTLNCALQGFFLTSELWINQIATDAIRGRLVAVYAALGSAGFAIGPIIIQWLGTTSWMPFIAGAAMILLAMIPLLIARRLVPPVAEAPASAMFGFLLRSPSASVAGLCYGAIEFCLAGFLAVYAVRLGTAEAEATLFLAAWGLGNLMLQPFIGWLSDNIDRRVVLLICGVAVVAGAAVLYFIPPSGWPALLLVFVWGGFIAGIYTVGLAHLGSSFKGSDLAAANAAFAFLYALGSIGGPGLGGVAIDVWKPYGLLLAVAGLGAVLISVVAWRILAVRRPLRTRPAA